MTTWVEIWDKQAWEAENKAARDSFEDHEASLAKLGIF
jgi:DNA-binding transcriptional regulator/RsmH inhibitor MraZ